MRTFLIIFAFLFFCQPCAAQKITRVTVSATAGRTAKFERDFARRQFNAGLIFSYKLTRRLSVNFTVTQPFESAYPTYSTRMVWKLFEK